MTRIDFYYNVPDKLAYVCRLLRKALDTTPSVIVTGQAQQLAALDQQIWQFAPAAFIGHVWLESPGQSVTPAMRDCARVWLTTAPEASTRHDLLVNLADTVPPGFESYQRLIEVVALAQEDRELARTRWRYYKTRGYQPVKHDIQERVQAEKPE